MLIWGAVFAVAGHGAAAPEPKSPPQEAPHAIRTSIEDTPDAYRLRFGDQLEISVWGMDDLNRQVEVHEDGNFLFPLAGNIEARDKTLKEVERQIQEGLNRYFRSDQAPQEQEATPTSRRIIAPNEVTNEVYRLQIGDQLEISVWSHDDLNKKAQILEDGAFSFPLIGNVQASGHTLKEVEQEVQQRLDKDYIVNPQVTVLLSDARYSILGDVKAPGQFPVQGSMDLLTAITQAGGTNPLASNRTEIMRDSGKTKIVIQAHLDQILQGKEPNVAILPRDSIYVKEIRAAAEKKALQVIVRLFGAKYAVLGDVERPGSYPIESTMDLLTAISQAGGTTKFASSKVEIIRGNGKEQQRVRANLDRIIRGRAPNMAIYPHDTIYVRRRLL